MSTVRQRARARRAVTRSATGFHLADLGVYGFDRHETTILAALVTEDPLLLVGRSGTGKTFLLNTLSEALGLEHRHYNASLISFDDLVGFPYPDEAHSTVRFLETPATVWGAESVLIDELSRCKPEHQNRLFSLVHERRLQGLPLARLRYRWAAMNPCTSDQGGTEDYSGSEALDPALADRFALVVTAADWNDLTAEQQAAIVAPSGEGQVTPRNEALCNSLRWLARAVPRAGECVPAAGDDVRHDGRQRTERCGRAHLAAPRAPARPEPRRGHDRREPRHVGGVPQRARVQPAAPDLGAGGGACSGGGGAPGRVGSLARQGGRLDPRVPRGAAARPQARAAAHALHRQGRGLAGDRATDRQREAGPRGGVRVRGLPGRARGPAADRRRGRERPRQDRGAADGRRGRDRLAGAAQRARHQPPVDRADRQGARRRCATAASRGPGSSSGPASCAASRSRRPRRSSSSSTSA